MCHLCGEKSRPETKPKKRKCSERNLVEKKDKTVNTRVTETYQHFRENKKRGEIKQKEKYKVIEHKFSVKKKGLDVIPEELKQRIKAKTTKIKRYYHRIKQDRINRLFQQDQNRVYEQLNGKFESSEKSDN